MTAIVDPVTKARKDGCWKRDVSPNCRCPHTWVNEPQGYDPADPRSHGVWERREGSSCVVHPS